MSLILRDCDQCDREYAAESRYLNRGQGKFCSRSCAAKWNGANKFTISVPNTVCAWCDKKFYRAPSKQRNSKSGIYFCCREHKDLAQRIEGGISTIHPPQYGLEDSRYRKRAIKYYGTVCQNCGWSGPAALLEVNHRDINRENNRLDNLEVLCPTCHRLFHWLTATAFWKGTSLPLPFKDASKLWYRDLSVHFNL